MTDFLNITTIQSAIIWEDIEANLAMFSKKIGGLSNQTDLVILPEMFTTGFSMNAAPLAEEMNGKTVAWMKEEAASLGAAIAGSFIVKDGRKFFNRLVWMFPDGHFETYDKRHLFKLADEHKTYSAGNRKQVVNWKGWKICPQICYDLRFPVWSRNTEGYDLLIYIASWPERRSSHWKQLLIARAIENQSYVIGVNRVGTDGKNFSYTGDTSVIDYSGKVLYRVSETEDIFTTTLSHQALSQYREVLPFLADRDGFEIES